MGNLRYVTLTGVDERCDLDELVRISNDFPTAEWGVLYSPERAGLGGRYPSLDWIEAFARRTAEAGLPIALHLCGQAVKTLLSAVATGKPFPAEAERLFALTEWFGRVQLNTRAKLSDEVLFRRVIERIVRTEARTRVILQWTPQHAELCARLAHDIGFEMLIDSSGGRGVSPEDWPTLPRPGKVGFAGGLGLGNLTRELPRIAAAAGDRPFWVDMETSLRNQADDFDLWMCREVLTSANIFELHQSSDAGAKYGNEWHRVDQLRGLWLNWWVGEAQKLNLVMPPIGAHKAVALDRHMGEYHGYEPTEQDHVALSVFQDERIALIPTEEGVWSAYPVEAPEHVMFALDIHTAGLRAVVAKHFGPKVPANPTIL